MHHETESEDILHILRKDGFRITQTRRELITIFLNKEKPLSVQELLSELKKKKLPVNKTTVYRELEFLQSKGIVRDVQLDHHQKHFELALGSHHHHIRCLECGIVADIYIPNELSTAKKHIEQQTAFDVVDHSLEFVGFCARCARDRR